MGKSTSSGDRSREETDRHPLIPAAPSSRQRKPISPDFLESASHPTTCAPCTREMVMAPFRLKKVWFALATGIIASAVLLMWQVIAGYRAEMGAAPSADQAPLRSSQAQPAPIPRTGRDGAEAQPLTVPMPMTSASAETCRLRPASLSLGQTRQWGARLPTGRANPGGRFFDAALRPRVLNGRSCLLVRCTALTRLRNGAGPCGPDPFDRLAARPGRSDQQRRATCSSKGWRPCTRASTTPRGWHSSERAN